MSKLKRFFVRAQAAAVAHRGSWLGRSVRGSRQEPVPASRRESTESSFSHWSKSHRVHTINSDDGLRKPQITHLYAHQCPVNGDFFPLTYVYNNYGRLLLYVYVILINSRNKGQ